MFHQCLSGFCVSIRTVSLAVWLLMIKVTGKGFTNECEKLINSEEHSCKERGGKGSG